MSTSTTFADFLQDVMADLQAGPQVSEEQRGYLSVRLDAMEIAKGHDGFFRGDPEPVVVLGLYSIVAEHVELLKRHVLNFSRPRSYPCTVLSEHESAMRTSVMYNGETRVLLVAVAMERDSGRDIADLYAKLERPHLFSFWSPNESIPAPKSIAELACSATKGRPCPMSVLVNGVQAERVYESDAWVGCTAVSVASHKAVYETLRLHFVAADERNDWTALAKIHYRP